MVVPAGSVYVTAGSDRRESGTHYTPAQPHRADRAAHARAARLRGTRRGVAEGGVEAAPADELLALKVCDMAMGSGAFLVQACRYLAERLVEAWEAAERPTAAASRSRRTAAQAAVPTRPDRADERLHSPAARRRPLPLRRGQEPARGRDGQALALADHAPEGPALHLPRPRAPLRRLAARRCQHRPAQPTGPSTRRAPQRPWFSLATERALTPPSTCAARLHSFQVRDIRDAESKARLLREAEEAMELVRLGADLLIAAALQPARRQVEKSGQLLSEFMSRPTLTRSCGRVYCPRRARPKFAEASTSCVSRLTDLLRDRNPFHWPLEFPEVFIATEEPVIIDGRLPLNAEDLLAGAVEADGEIWLWLRSYCRQSAISRRSEDHRFSWYRLPQLSGGVSCWRQTWQR